MQNFELNSLLDQVSSESQRYYEFLRQPSMSMGIYRLDAGETDTQNPHEEDEVYYVLSGRGKLNVEKEMLSAVPGSILFVEAHVNHKFVEIEEDLTLLVFFAPAETKT